MLLPPYPTYLCGYTHQKKKKKKKKKKNLTVL
jgi:hypothetical protein